MDDAVLVRSGERVGNLAGVGTAMAWQRAAREAFGERVAGDQLHHQELSHAFVRQADGADVVDTQM